MVVCTEENLDEAAKAGVIATVVDLLRALNGGETGAENSPPPGVEELERDICFVLGLMAIKPEHQIAICNANALPTLVAMIKRYAKEGYTKVRALSGTSAQACRRAADAITNLAHENNSIKNWVRLEGGVFPLVTLLHSVDPKVQRAVAGTLRTLAFKNEENKNLIVERGALPLLIHMLRAEDSSIHYEAVGVIGNLVHSSHHIKQRVLDEGALQAVIELLSSPCQDSQREAALLLGQFATADGDYKSKIVQRGAVGPLIEMLTSRDVQLKEMAAFALGRLAQHHDNQAGIMSMGGLPPLLSLLDSSMPNLQHNAAFALYGLSENEDNLLHFIRNGALQRIQDCNLIPQASRDCIQKMTKRLQERLNGRMLGQALYILQGSQENDKVTIATALGLLFSNEYPTPKEFSKAMLERNVLIVLLDTVSNPKSSSEHQRQAATALHNVAVACGSAADLDLQTPSQNQSSLNEEVNEVEAPPEPRGSSHEGQGTEDDALSGYLGSKYINNPSMSDVKFIVEGKEFHAHKVQLHASSEIFRSMLEGDYKERMAASIPIPNIRWPVFEAMMTCIYTGKLEVQPDLAQELLQVSDQYMLDRLKHFCEAAINKQLTADNVSAVFELAESFNAPELAKRCALYCLHNYSKMIEHFEQTSVSLDAPKRGSKETPVQHFAHLINAMIPRLRAALVYDIQDRAGRDPGDHSLESDTSSLSE